MWSYSQLRHRLKWIKSVATRRARPSEYQADLPGYGPKLSLIRGKADSPTCRADPGGQPDETYRIDSGGRPDIHSFYI